MAVAGIYQTLQTAQIGDVHEFTIVTVFAPDCKLSPDCSIQISICQALFLTNFTKIFVSYSLYICMSVPGSGQKLLTQPVFMCVSENA
jgi:hypothetical protein